MADHTPVRGIPRSSAAMMAQTCQHLCATAAKGQQYLAAVAAGEREAAPDRVAAAHAATARLHSCVCPS